MRHAAAQALSHLVEGAAHAGSPSSPSGSGPSKASEGGSELAAAAQRVLFPQLKKGLASPNLAVRQVGGAVSLQAPWPH